jgi:hypothetical protein
LSTALHAYYLSSSRLLFHSPTHFTSSACAHRSHPHTGTNAISVTACIGVHVSEFMYRSSCIGVHVSEFMYRSSCIGVHVSEFMYRSCVTQRRFGWMAARDRKAVRASRFSRMSLRIVYTGTRTQTYTHTIPVPCLAIADLA